MTKPNNLKPIYWLLFAAGGMIAALVLPALVVILSWLLPFGVVGSADTFYQTVSPLFQNGLFYLVVVAVLFVIPNEVNGEPDTCAQPPLLKLK